jgi:endonuclease/exonuclease/phosphatase family metal-dependent hydrolase
MPLFLFLATGQVFSQALASRGMAVPEGYQYPQKSSFTLLSWNVEHFVDLHDNPYIHNRREDSPDTALYAIKIALLVEALREADADLVVLQEFESAAFLKALADSLLPDMGYQFFAGAESFNWYMNVVMMSRYPLGLTYGYRSLYTSLLQPDGKPQPDKAQININSRIVSQEVFVRPDQALVITGVHLKAGRNPEDEAARQGQIAMLQQQLQRLTQENKNIPLLLVGDLNATPDSPELRSLTQPQSKRHPRWIDPLANHTEVFSHPADAPRWRIDYILMNSAMHKNYLPESLHIGGLLGNDPERLRTLSDHLPLHATFQIK